MSASSMLALAVSAFLVTGCAASPEDGLGADQSASDVAATVEVKLEGEGVQFLLHVTNTGETPLEFTFPSSQRYDFVVRDQSGEEVWRWSDGMSFLQAISNATLAPGETWDFRVTWEAGNRAGQYEVAAMVTAQEHDVRQSAAFELP